MRTISIVKIDALVYVLTLNLVLGSGDWDHSPISGDGHAHLSVSAVVLEAVLQHTLVLLQQVVPALVGGRRGAVVARGDRRGGGVV